MTQNGGATPSPLPRTPLPPSSHEQAGALYQQHRYPTLRLDKDWRDALSFLFERDRESIESAAVLVAPSIVG
jgi:hypothetical protein